MPYLFAHPGAILVTNAPYPVDASLQFLFIRTQDPDLGEIYGGSVSFNSVSPAPGTTNSVHSPHNYFNTEVYPGARSSISMTIAIPKACSRYPKMYRLI